MPHAVVEKRKQGLKRKEIYYDGCFYDVTDWISKHPGGKVIEYYTEENEDATIPIQQFHLRSINQVLARMKTLPKRPTNNNGGVSQSSRYRKLSADFQALFADLMNEGYFKPSPIHAAFRFFEVALYFWLAYYCAALEIQVLSRVLGVFFNTCAAVRSAFAMHEGGHASLTGNVKFDRWLHAIHLTLAIGLSSTWWSSQHNRHHAMPQRVHRDVDLNTLPLLAFNSKIALDAKGGNNFFTRNQAKLFFTIDTFLVGFFWKFYLSPKYIIHKRQWGQIVMTILHFTASMCWIGPINYFLSLWLISIWLFGTFTLSHSHLPVTTEIMHWVEYSLMHTVNVEPSWWCDWVMGYLNYQIEHHLFPTMPQFRQRQISARVRELAEKNSIPYRCISYVEAIKTSFRNLVHVSEDIVKHKVN